MSERRFDSTGQPVINETGPKVRALAVRNWNDPTRMLGDVSRIYAALSEFGVQFMGTGSTHHRGNGREADITILFECTDTTYARLRRIPEVCGAFELDPHTVMRNLDADIMHAYPDEITTIRRGHRANIIERLMLECTPTSLHRVTKHLTRSGVTMTGVKKPDHIPERDEVARYRIYIQNIIEKARASLTELMQKHNIDGGWGNKTTVRMNGNVLKVQALQQHLITRFEDRLDRIDLGAVTAIIREEDRQPTVRVD